MPKLSNLIPSKFLKAKDIPRDGLDLTIARVESGTLTDQRDHTSKTVYTLHWQEPGVKPLTLNSVNTKTLIAWFGDVDTAELVGKPVKVIRMMAQVWDKMQWTVRIEPPEETEEGQEEHPTGEPDEIPL